MSETSIAVFGATGNLGLRITRELVSRGARVSAIVRNGSDEKRLERLKKLNVTVRELNFADQGQLIDALKGSACVVSALSGSREVIVDLQALVLKAALQAGVPRFIPSDFSIDFRNLRPEENRNLSWRKEFMSIIDQTGIKTTTVFNGAFMELLNGQAPFIVYRMKRVLCWGSPQQKMDFTTMDDTAAFTAEVALDASAPRFLHIAGSRVSARELTEIASEMFGEKYSLFTPGGVRTLGWIIRIVKLLNPAPNDLYPAWQGMQYMHNMFKGGVSNETLDNGRYPSVHFTNVNEQLKTHRKTAEC